jgi:hypothetical protein
MKGRDDLEGLNARWRVTLKWIMKKVGLYKGVERIHLAQDMGKYQDIVNVETGLLVP